jgi:hypothetical protein
MVDSEYGGCVFGINRTPIKDWRRHMTVLAFWQFTGDSGVHCRNIRY